METRGFVIRNFRNVGVCEGNKSQEAFLRLPEIEGEFGGLIILFSKHNSGKSNVLMALKKFSDSCLYLEGSQNLEGLNILSQDDIPKLPSKLTSIALACQEPAYYLHYPQKVAIKSSEAQKKRQAGKSLDFRKHLAELQDDFDGCDVYLEQKKHEDVDFVKLLLKNPSGGGRFIRCTTEPLKSHEEFSSDKLNVEGSKRLCCPFVVGYRELDVEQNFVDYIKGASQYIESSTLKEYGHIICLEKGEELKREYYTVCMKDESNENILFYRHFQKSPSKQHKQKRLHVPRIVFYKETHFCNDDFSVDFDRIQESHFFQNIDTQISQDFNMLCGIQDDDKACHFRTVAQSGKMTFEIYRGKQGKPLSLEEQDRDFRKLFDFIFSLNHQINGLQKGDIVLIDDVGESLDGSIQIRLRKYLKELAQKRGILFIVSTDSPFMLDMNCLDEIRILKEQNNGLGFEIINDFTLNNSSRANILPTTNGLFGIEYCHMLNPKSAIVIVENIEHYNYLTTFASLYAKNSEDMQFAFLPFHAYGKENGRKKALQSLIELGKKIVTPTILLVEHNCIGKEIQESGNDFSGRIKVVVLNEVPKLKARFGEQEELKIEDLFAEEDQKTFGINKNNKGGTQSSFFKNATNHERLGRKTRENFFALLAYLYCSDKRDILERPFLNALKFFYEQAVDNADKGTTKGSKIVETENRFNEALEVLGLKCAVSFGSGKTADQQGIAFVRKDTLGKYFVNGETPSPTRGIYLWFCYDKSAAPEERLYLEFGYSWDDDNVPCEAFRKLNNNKTLNRAEWDGKHKAYPDFENHKDAILNDFLNFASYYKSFDARDFRIQPTTGA